MSKTTQCKVHTVKKRGGERVHRVTEAWRETWLIQELIKCESDQTIHLTTVSAINLQCKVNKNNRERGGRSTDDQE